MFIIILIVGGDGESFHLEWKFFRFGKEARHLLSRRRCWSNISYLDIVVIVVLEMEVACNAEVGVKKVNNDTGQVVMRWSSDQQSDQSDQSFPSQVEVREAEGVSRKPGSAASIVINLVMVRWSMTITCALSDDEYLGFWTKRRR